MIIRQNTLVSRSSLKASRGLQATVLALIVLAAPMVFAQDGWTERLKGWWLTADQQGQRFYERGDYAQAAETFEDLAWRGAAYYRAGEFEKAAGVFGRVPTADAAYNRGNALIFLGQYDDAIASYDLALNHRPGWTEAEQNRSLAIARKARLAPAEDVAGGTDGMLGADEIVFDDTGRVNRSGQEQEMQSEQGLSSEEMRAVWLRRVQNDPANFLRARFAYQLARDDVPEQGDE